MKIILLIIASENEHKYYEMKEFWKTYMNIHPNIQSYFLYNKPDISENVVIEGDTMYIRDYETYIPGILNKTIRAFEYCAKNFEFDYIYRTNLSSFVDFSKAYEYLLQNKLYYGGCGVGFYSENGIETYFASGCGFIVSRKAIQTLIDTKYLLKNDVIDDVSIGNLLTKYYDITSLERADIENVEDTRLYNDIAAFHYRCKCDDYKKTILIFEKLKDKIY
jgi:hypothetical protein